MKYKIFIASILLVLGVLITNDLKTSVFDEGYICELTYKSPLSGKPSEDANTLCNPLQKPTEPQCTKPSTDAEKIKICKICPAVKCDKEAMWITKQASRLTSAISKAKKRFLAEFFYDNGTLRDGYQHAIENGVRKGISDAIKIEMENEKWEGIWKLVGDGMREGMEREYEGGFWKNLPALAWDGVTRGIMDGMRGGIWEKMWKQAPRWIRGKAREGFGVVKMGFWFVYKWYLM